MSCHSVKLDAVCPYSTRTFASKIARVSQRRSLTMPTADSNCAMVISTTRQVGHRRARRRGGGGEGRARTDGKQIAPYNQKASTHLLREEGAIGRRQLLLHVCEPPGKKHEGFQITLEKTSSKIARNVESASTCPVKAKKDVAPSPLAARVQFKPENRRGTRFTAPCGSSMTPKHKGR